MLLSAWREVSKYTRLSAADLQQDAAALDFHMRRSYVRLQ